MRVVRVLCFKKGDKGGVGLRLGMNRVNLILFFTFKLIEMQIY